MFNSIYVLLSFDYVDDIDFDIMCLQSRNKDGYVYSRQTSSIIATSTPLVHFFPVE